MWGEEPVPVAGDNPTRLEGLYHRLDKPWTVPPPNCAQADNIRRHSFETGVNDFGRIDMDDPEASHLDHPVEHVPVAKVPHTGRPGWWHGYRSWKGDSVEIDPPMI